MFAAFLNLRLCCKKLQNTTVFFRIDNTYAASWGNKQAAHKTEILSLVTFWGDFYWKKNNGICQKVSDNLEWSFKDQFFQNLNRGFGLVIRH